MSCQITKWTITVIKTVWQKNQPKGTELRVQKQSQVYAGISYRVKVAVQGGKQDCSIHSCLFDYSCGVNKGRFNELLPILEYVWHSASNVVLLTFSVCDGNCLSLHSATNTIKNIQLQITQFKPETGLQSALRGMNGALTQVDFMEKTKPTLNPKNM